MKRTAYALLALTLAASPVLAAVTPYAVPLKDTETAAIEYGICGRAAELLAGIVSVPSANRLDGAGDTFGSFRFYCPIEPKK
jgi:hypothetical protein